ncbi:FAD-dependent oxidoreductase [Mesorhizobium sp. M1312]|uniref:NAD(P)/FAD-dependent oxidoreductase n=1 Tax=unclassified Mesorhizobium TaxID=325217 RepID=UPI003336B91B
MPGIVIIGAGQAGASLAAEARQLGYAGPITLIGDEPVAPYQRPPLSKAYLLGQAGLDRMALRATSFWGDHGIDLRVGRSVTAIDREVGRVWAGGESFRYEHLAIATGSSARQLPEAQGGLLQGVYTIRNIADVDAMAGEFRPNRKLLIIGGGYIGLEAAAVGAKLGLKVTLIEMAPRILQRVAAAETSSFFRELHLSNGVVIRENIALERLVGTGRVSGAVLSDGTELPVDFAIVGIGIMPRTRLAQEADLVIENGIRTDAHGRTSDQHIWAVGDCASFPHEGGRIRLESVGHAIHQGEVVARNILGMTQAYEAKPWFWSDQYDVKLQIAGLNAGYDRVLERKGEEGSRSIWYYRGDRLLAVDAINDARAYMVGKRILESRHTIAPHYVVDAATDVKTLISRAVPVSVGSTVG